MNSNNLWKKISKQTFWYVTLGLLLFFIDQITKYLVYDKGQGNFLEKFRPVIGKLIFPNYNFAFSLLVPIVIIYIIYFILLAGLIFWFARAPRKTVLLKLGLTFVLAGAAANIYDRVALGYVRDFIYIFWGNIFNSADIFIVTGILMLLA